MSCSFRTRRRSRFTAHAVTPLPLRRRVRSEMMTNLPPTWEGLFFIASFLPTDDATPSSRTKHAHARPSVCVRRATERSRARNATASRARARVRPARGESTPVDPTHARACTGPKRRTQAATTRAPPRRRPRVAHACAHTTSGPHPVASPTRGRPTRRPRSARARAAARPRAVRRVRARAGSGGERPPRQRPPRHCPPRHCQPVPAKGLAHAAPRPQTTSAPPRSAAPLPRRAGSAGAPRVPRTRARVERDWRRVRETRPRRARERGAARGAAI